MQSFAVGDVVAGRFIVAVRAARGGSGEVFRVTEDAGDRSFALKVSRRTSASAIGTFRHEADVLAQITHPGVCRCYDHGVLDDGRAYLVTHWIDGPSIADLLDSGALSTAVALRIALAIADVLSVLHSSGIIHCDVKPLNILVPRLNGRLCYSASKLIDFGISQSLARLSDTGEWRGSIGRCAGTADFMAPEQFTGRRNGLETDTYGLGATLFAMLYGRPPYVGGELSRIVAPRPGMPRPFIGPFVVRRLTEPVTIPDSPPMPRGLRELLADTLCLRLEDRPTPIGEVTRRLYEQLADCTDIGCAVADVG